MALHAAPCRNCRYLRDARSEEFGKSFKVCGWWDDRNKWPSIASPSLSIFDVPHDGARAIPKSRLDPTLTDEMRDCAVRIPMTE